MTNVVLFPGITTFKKFEISLEDGDTLTVGTSLLGKKVPGDIIHYIDENYRNAEGCIVTIRPIREGP